MSKDFTTLLVAQLPRLRAYAIMLTRNLSDAEDLMQTAAVRALQAESQFVPGTNFAAWIHRIIRNVFLDTCRGAKRRNAVSLDDVPEDSLARPDGLHDYVLSREVARAVDRLPAHQRACLTLASANDLTQAEMSVVLACSVATVKSRLWRARSSMHALLGEGGDARAGSSQSRLAA